MKKAILIVTVLFIAVISTACINNLAVQELNNKAKIFMDNGDYESAINRLQASIDLDSTIFETHYNLGIAYIKAHKYKDAVETLTKAIELNANQADTYYSLAVAQESYAKELLDLNEKVDSSDEGTDALNPDDKMSPEQRKLAAIELYTNAIVSYKTYLDKAPNSSDSDSVKSQISGIEEELAELKIQK